MNIRILIPHLLLIFLTTSLKAQLEFEDVMASVIDVSISHGDITSVGLGPGISFVDYNGDGWDDISIPASSTKDFQFLKNVGGTFEIDPLSITSDNHQARQISWVDYDNDGDLDFFATGEQGDLWLYKNDEGSYTNVTETSGLTILSIAYWGNSWGDYDNDGYLDVFISVRDNSQIDHNMLYRNNGNGTFTDVTEAAQLLDIGYITFCSAFFDYDNDGDQDIYTANDKDVTPNKLYRNNGDGTFTDISIESGTNLYMSAMSTTIDDYNNDGWLDIYVTNFYPSFVDDATPGNALLRNNGDGTFTNLGLESNTRFDSIGWGAVFLDADSDMDKDLYVSGMPDGFGELISSAFYENLDLENFQIRNDIGFGANPFTSIGNALGDLDNDGLADIVVVNVDDQPLNLWKNVNETGNHWLKVNLEGVISNTMGIGAMLELTTGNVVQYNYTLCGEGYASQNSRNEFFGLGASTEVDQLKIIWPSGEEDIIENIEVDQTIKVREGEGVVLSISDEIVSSQYLHVYPIPVSKFLNIEYVIEETSRLSVFNMNGQRVLQEQIGATSKSTQLDCRKLSSGLYIIEVRGEQYVQRTKILID